MFRQLPSIRSIALAAGFAMTAAGASASMPQGPVTVVAPTDALVERVNHADLNLSTASDRRQLTHRVGAAVHRVCNPGRFDTGLSQPEQTGCEAAAWDDVKPQMALAVQRATQIARNGFSTIPEVALTVALPAASAL